MTSTSSETPANSEKLSFSLKLAYGAGDLGTAITANILIFFLLPFFTNVAGIPAGLAGTVLMIGKISDAINDPIIGVLSDRTRHRWGRRLPWMMYGAIPFGIFYLLQWIIPPLNNVGLLFGYYVLIGILFNLGYTSINLPYVALTPELTQDYNERTSLNSFRFMFSIGGSIVSLLLAMVIFSVGDNPAQQYLILGLVCTAIAIVSLYSCIFGIRDRVMQAERRFNERADTSASIPIAQQLRVAFSNRPFLYVIGIYLCSWLAVQVTASILQLYVVSHMGLPIQTFTTVALAVQGTALVMLFVWSKVSQRFGKKSVYFMGMGLWMIAQFGLLMLQPGQIVLMYVLSILAGFGVSTAYLVPWSMLPDVIELDELNTGQRREGIFYAFMVLLQKIGLALGLFLVGVALEAAGYIETAAGQPLPQQPESAILAIRLAIGPLPMVCLIGGMILAYFYPITREMHAEILLKLRERKQQSPDSPSV
ncbi:MAG: MFS transporter [Desertifilum sp.]|nr:MFS transporter [Desertifilum sp.]